MSAQPISINSQETEEDKPQGLDESLQKELLSLWRRCCAEGLYADRLEVKDVRLAEMYWSGSQYNWWSTTLGQWQSSAQGGISTGNNDELDDMPRFQYVTNIYQSYGLSWIAVLSATPPRIRFFPDDAEDGDDVETAEGYTTLTECIERWNPPSKLLQDAAYFAWTGGLVGAYVRYVSDSDKYGTEEIKDMEMGHSEVEPETLKCQSCGWSAPADYAQPPVPCPKCGQELTGDNIASAQTAPQVQESESEEISKGREVITIVGALNLKRPQWVQSQAEYHYLGYEREVHYSQAKAAYPDVADKIKGGSMASGDEAYRRIARLSLQQGTNSQSQTGDALANLVTVADVWFRKSAFFMVEDVEVRKQLISTFPKGCHVTFAGDVYCKSSSESMDEHWVVKHALPGQGQHRPAVGSSTISLQDRFNTMCNISMETYEYGLPITYRAQDTFDVDANQEQQAEPGSEVPIQLKPDQNIQNRIMTSRTDSVSPDMQKHMMDLMGPMAQFISGAQASSFGAEEGGAGETAAGYKMMREQSLGRMGIVYSNMKQFYADIMTIGCEDLKENCAGKVGVSVKGSTGEFETNAIDVTQLKGTAKAHPEGSENFPVLWEQRRETFMQLVDSPQGQALMTDPDNQALGLEIIGIKGLVLPMAAARTKAIKTIKELSMSPFPIPVEIDPVFDDLAGEFGTVKNWINGSDGQKCKLDNPQGFQNVKDYGTQLKQAMAPPPPPPDKPPSESINFKDLPDDGKVQLAAKVGLQLKPEDFIEQRVDDIAVKSGVSLGKPAPTGNATPGQPTGQSVGQGAAQ